MSNELQKRFRCVAQAAQKAHSHLKTRPLLPELKNLYLGAVVKSVDALSQLALAHGPKRINEAPKMQDLHEQEDEIAAWLSLLTLLMVERPEISSPKGPILSPLHYSTLNLLNIMVRDKEFTRGEVLDSVLLDSSSPGLIVLLSDLLGWLPSITSGAGAVAFAMAKDGAGDSDWDSRQLDPDGPLMRTLETTRLLLEVTAPSKGNQDSESNLSPARAALSAILQETKILPSLCSLHKRLSASSLRTMKRQGSQLVGGTQRQQQHRLARLEGAIADFSAALVHSVSSVPPSHDPELIGSCLDIFVGDTLGGGQASPLRKKKANLEPEVVKFLSSRIAHVMSRCERFLFSDSYQCDKMEQESLKYVEPSLSRPRSTRSSNSFRFRHDASFRLDSSVRMTEGSKKRIDDSFKSDLSELRSMVEAVQGITTSALEASTSNAEGSRAMLSRKETEDIVSSCIPALFTLSKVITIDLGLFCLYLESCMLAISSIARWLLHEATRERSPHWTDQQSMPRSSSFLATPRSAISSSTAGQSMGLGPLASAMPLLEELAHVIASILALVTSPTSRESIANQLALLEQEEVGEANKKAARAVDRDPKESHDRGLDGLWEALGHDVHGCPVLIPGRRDHKLRSRYEAIIGQLLQSLSSIVIDAVLPWLEMKDKEEMAEEEAIRQRAGNLNFLFESEEEEEEEERRESQVSMLMCDLVSDGLLLVIEWTFLRAFADDRSYYSSSAQPSMEDIARISASRLLKAVLSSDSTYATRRQGAWSLRASRRWMNERLPRDGRKINSRGAKTIQILAEELLPLAGSSLRSLDPSPGVPNQSQVLGAALTVVHFFPPITSLISLLLSSRMDIQGNLSPATDSQGLPEMAQRAASLITRASQATINGQMQHVIKVKTELGTNQSTMIKPSGAALDPFLSMATESGPISSRWSRSPASLSVEEICEISRSDVDTLTRTLFSTYLVQVSALLLGRVGGGSGQRRMEVLDVGLDLALESIAMITRDIIVGGYYTLTTRDDPNDDLSYKVLREIAIEQESNEQGDAEGLSHKMNLKVTDLDAKFQLRLKGDSLDTSFGLGKKQPLATLEELVSLVLLCSRRPQLAVSLIASGALSALHSVVSSLAATAPGEVPRLNLLVIGHAMAMRNAVASCAEKALSSCAAKLSVTSVSLEKQQPGLLKSPTFKKSLSFGRKKARPAPDKRCAAAVPPPTRSPPTLIELEGNLDQILNIVNKSKIDDSLIIDLLKALGSSLEAALSLSQCEQTHFAKVDICQLVQESIHSATLSNNYDGMTSPRFAEFFGEISGVVSHQDHKVDGRDRGLPWSVQDVGLWPMLKGGKAGSILMPPGAPLITADSLSSLKQSLRHLLGGKGCKEEAYGLWNKAEQPSSMPQSPLRQGPVPPLSLSSSMAKSLGRRMKKPIGSNNDLSLLQASDHFLFLELQTPDSIQEEVFDHLGLADIHQVSDAAWARRILDPQRIEEVMKRVNQLADTLKRLAPLCATLPSIEPRDLVNDLGLIGCNNLECSHQGADAGSDAHMSDVVLEPCAGCSGPHYCSKECSQSAFSKGHWMKCGLWR